MSEPSLLPTVLADQWNKSTWPKILCPIANLGSRHSDKVLLSLLLAKRHYQLASDL